MYFARHLACRAWLHEAGISYRNILGYGEIRWEDIEQIYFGAAEVHVHGIPLGTFERLKIITNLQKRISFGGNIRNTAVLNAAAAQRTFERMHGKAVQEFNNGSELEFGAIRVSLSHGVTVQKWFFSRTIPWREIAAF